MVQFNEAINFEWSRDVAELMFELKGIEISYKPHSTWFIMPYSFYRKSSLRKH